MLAVGVMLVGYGWFVFCYFVGLLFYVVVLVVVDLRFVLRCGFFDMLFVV